MSAHRFFAAGNLPHLAPEEEFALPLTPDDAHHAARVLRLRAGEQVVLVAPDRQAFECVLTSVHDADKTTGAAPQLCAEIIRPVDPIREPRVTLIQGLPKAGKMELVIEKAVEIGIEAVWPVGFARSVTRLDADRGAKKGERWRRVAEAAAKQSGRTFVPTVLDPSGERGLIGRLVAFDLVLVASEADVGTAPGVGQAIQAATLGPDPRVAMIVGPEGGFTHEELAALSAAGVIAVSLGDTILRTETAGILAAALCVYELGGLGGRSCD